MSTDAGPMRLRTRKRTWVLLSLGAVVLIALVWSVITDLEFSRRPATATAADSRSQRFRRRARGQAHRSRNQELVGSKLDLAKAERENKSSSRAGRAGISRSNRAGPKRPRKVVPGSGDL